MKQLHTEEELLAAYNKAPVLVQESLSEGSAVDFIMTLQNKYQLHVDIAGTVSGMVRDILLGFLSPEGFFNELKAIGIEDSVATSLVKDLNEKVFIPLRNKMRNSSIEEKGSSNLPKTPIQNLIPLTPKPTTQPQKDASILPVASTESRPLTVATVPVPAPTPVPSINQQKSTPAPLITIPAEPLPTVPAMEQRHELATQAPQLRTMAKDMEWARDRRQTVGNGVSVHIQDQDIHPVTGQPAASVRVFIPSQAPQPPTPVAQPIYRQSLAPLPEPQVTAPPESIHAATPLDALVKKATGGPVTSNPIVPGSTDPYREPV